jgi:small GTP-binding protein
MNKFLKSVSCPVFLVQSKSEIFSMMKLVLVGNSKVGKTSLFQRYINDKFSEEYLMTIGMNSETKDFQFQENSFKINLSDYIGGTGEFRPMPRSYFHCDGILLCFDLTNKNSFQKLDFWMEMILKNKNEKTSVCLIGTKSDLTEKEVTSEEIQNFISEHRINYFVVSSKTGHNVDKTFNAFIHQILEKDQSKFFLHKIEHPSTCEMS